MSQRSLIELFELITTDFNAFCKHCITISARTFTRPPDEEEIIDIQFILTDHQVEFLEYLERKDISDKIVLKCRQRGFSEFMLAYCLWKVLYGRNEKILYLIDSLPKCKDFLTKIKNMYRRIPAQFRPTGISILASNMVENLLRNNVVNIKTAKGEAVRSGTFSMIVLDEIAFYEERIQKEIAAGINSSCPSNRVWISTPKQEDDLYHHKVLAAKAEGTLYTHSYWDDVDSWYGSMEMAKQWRAADEKGQTQAAINRELDCLFSGAAEDLIWFIEPNMFRSYVPKPNAMCLVSLDLGWSDDTSVLFARDYGQILHVFDELIVNETTIPAVANLIKGRNYRIKYGIMDAAGKKVDQTSGISSHRQMQQRLGCRFYTRKTEKIEMVRVANSAMLEGRVYIDAKGCPNLVQMFGNYEYQKNKIPHTRYSHQHDSFVYLVYNWLKKPKRDLRPRMIKRSSLRI